MEIRLNDGVVYYEDVHPKGHEILVILHGWGHSSRVWKPWAERLSSQFRIIMPDLPLFGRSSPLPHHPGLKEYSKFTKEFLDKIGIAKVNLLGHSFGGQLAAKVVLEYPLLVNRLILVDPAIVREKEGFKKIKANFVKAVSKLKRLLPSKWRYQLDRSVDYAQASAKQKDLLKKLLATDLVPDLNKIDTSTLIVWGERDKEILGNGKRLMRLIRHSRLKVLYEVGHNPQIDSPALLQQTVERFLE